jgi:hypothetical protein
LKGRIGDPLRNLTVQTRQKQRYLPLIVFLENWSHIVITSLIFRYKDTQLTVNNQLFLKVFEKEPDPFETTSAKLKAQKGLIFRNAETRFQLRGDSLFSGV